MVRTTKIPCDGAIYTVHSDAYGTVTNVELDAGAAAEAASDSDEAMDEERARYAQILRELTEFEEAVTEAEELNLIAEDPEDDDDGNLDLS
jgi:hypothetical protein